MPHTTATVLTAHASRYLQQLCKHFGHKVPVEFTPETGRVSLPFGACEFAATSEALTLTATSEAANLPKLEQFLGSHLSRFAFRENPTIEWQRAA